MRMLGVVVDHTWYEDGKEPLIMSCCGLFLGNGYVLTHGKLLTDFITSTKAEIFMKHLKSSGSIDVSAQCPGNTVPWFMKTSKISVIFHSNDKNDICSNDSLSKSSITNNETQMNRTSNIQDTTFQLSAKLSYIWHDSKFKKAFMELMPKHRDWTFLEQFEDVGYENKIDVLSSFVLLRIDGPVSCERDHLWLYQKASELFNNSHKPYKGCPVYVESTPFANLSPGVFLNSLSRGILSCVPNIGNLKEPLLMMTDACCILGAEGAAVYESYNDGITGMCGFVVSPFCFKSGEWIGLTIVISARRVFAMLMNLTIINVKSKDIIMEYNKKILNEAKECDNVVSSTNSPNISLEIDSPGAAEQHGGHNESSLNLNKKFSNYIMNKEEASAIVSCESGVVRIYCKKSGKWGSGFIINKDPGIIITCSHVVNEMKDKNVVVSLTNVSQLYGGNIIYKTRPFTKDNRSESCLNHLVDVLDVAVIKTFLPLPTALHLSELFPPRGTPVYVLGHALISPDQNTSPSVFSGVISKIVHVPRSLLPDHSHLNNQSIVSINNSSSSLDSSVTKPLDRPNSPDSVIDDMTEVPIMLQTTCAVYPGTSGGPVVTLNTGYGIEVIGMVVSNAIDSIDKALYPHVNFSIPSILLRQPLASFIESGDVTSLRDLSFSSTQLQKIWSLDQILPSKL